MAFSPRLAEVEWKTNAPGRGRRSIADAGAME